MKITLNVTQKNIDEGTPCNAKRCAVAKALNDAGYPHVTVSGLGVSLYHGECALDGYTRAQGTPELGEFLSIFDRQPGLAKPVTLELEFLP